VTLVVLYLFAVDRMFESLFSFYMPSTWAVICGQKEVSASTRFYVLIFLMVISYAAFCFYQFLETGFTSHFEISVLQQAAELILDL